MKPVVVLAACLVACPCLAQSNCRLYIAGQYDWGAKRGFYLDLEGAKLSELPVILGMADGTDWHFTSHVPGFEVGRSYVITAEVAPDRGRILIDGQAVAEMEAVWAPAEGLELTVNDKPSWANEPGDWIGLVSTVTVEARRRDEAPQSVRFDLGAAVSRPVPLLLFGLVQSQTARLDVQPGDTLTLEAVLSFISSDPRPVAPLVDRYGQCAYGDWSTKVHTDADLTADIAREDEELAKTPPSSDYDQFGGYLKAGWREEGTGLFRTVRRDGKWWLVTPEGNPCFYVSVCSFPGQTWETTPVTGRELLYDWLPPKDGQFAPAWSVNQWGLQDGTDYFCFYAANLIRKYGADRWLQAAEERGVRRLRAWGFSGGGKWGAPASEVSAPVLGRWSVPNLVRHPDVFDTAVQALLRKDLEDQILPRRDDPRVLGWSLGNEYDEIITRAEVAEALRKPAETPAKRALVDHALNALHAGSVAELAAAWGIAASSVDDLYAATDPKVPDGDLEALRRFYEDAYYALIYDTVKSIDPNRLYVGNWIVPGWWEDEEDWRIVARHCDVIGYDRYDRQFGDERLKRLEEETDKPILCGEYSFPAWYDGMRGFGRYGCWAKDDAEAGELYEQWMRDATTDPHCVGVMWFIYRDQPLTGRGAGHGEQLVYGENYAFGLVTETDRPKAELVARVREANLNAAAWRVGE